jgi:hypothetical protein
MTQITRQQVIAAATARQQGPQAIMCVHTRVGSELMLMSDSSASTEQENLAHSAAS